MVSSHFHRPVSGSPPVDVMTAFQLWLVGTAVGVVGAVVALFDIGAVKQQMIQQIMRNSEDMSSQAEAETLIDIAFIVGGIIGVLLLLLQVFFAFRMRAGKNWARIVLTILGVFTVVSTFLALTNQNAGAIVSIISIIQAVIIGGGVYLMFRPESSKYFMEQQ